MVYSINMFLKGIVSISTVIWLFVQCSSASPIDDNVADNNGNCGYQSCHPTKEGYVNVHLIPHSHDDVGWVKTVDQFYYGTELSRYRAGVIYIYDNVLKAVQLKKDRRFIYVETAFFWKWWQEQEDTERGALRELVNEGRIEFTGGGWSMNDEAVTHYQSIIDQMTWGLKKLNDSFGECGRPKMGWQIDPFGHSSEMASIFAQLGYDGVILGRIDYEDKETRLDNRSMEMVWRGSNNLGRKTDIFTSVLYNHYDAPAGFCFDILCDDDPLVDDPDSPEYNIEERAEDFIVNHVQDSMESFQTSNVIVPMGRDFAYQEAEAWFKNIDRLIKYVNNKEVFNNTKYHLIYSTPSCYAAAVQEESQGILSSPLKVDDFLPYGTDPHAFWTGFYTSRPSLKRYERMGNNFLQICKQLYALTNMTPENESKLNSLRGAMGVMQHHDAVTGTETEQVAYDYARLLHIGMTNCENITARALSSLTDVTANSFETCLLANVSQCALTEKSDTFVVTVYNPLSRSVNKYVRLPVFGTSYTVTDPDGETMPSQILPIAKSVQNIKGRDSNATYELIFEAQNIPPLGFKSLYVTKQENRYDVTPEYLDLNFEFTNLNGVGFAINSSTGLIEKAEIDGVNLDIDQRFWYYNGSNGWGLDSKASGAYIFSGVTPKAFFGLIRSANNLKILIFQNAMMLANTAIHLLSGTLYFSHSALAYASSLEKIFYKRPDSSHPISKISDTAAFSVYQGDVVTEVHQTFNKYVSQVVRVYQHEKYIEFDWVVGPIEMSDSWPGVNGKEIISRFTTSLQSDSTFYTDSNGRELMKRTRNFRPTWDITVNETESSNYYPVTSKILIRDENENLEFAVLTDRAEGGSSLKDGEVELMLLRSSISDDELGVGEALIEIAYDQPIIARGSHYVTFGHIKNITESEKTVAAIEHEVASQKLLDSWIFLSVPSEKTFGEYKASHAMQFSGLTDSLPKNVHIMTLEPWTESSYLLRLEHNFEKYQDPMLSQPATVDLTNLFTTFEINSIRETTLGGNQWLEDNERLNFKSAYQSDELEVNVPYSKESSTNYEIDLDPMQIRTFIVEVAPKA